jgi:hypothetical protein
MRLLQLSLLLVSAVCVGCFDPDLGKNPFQCATSGKACPDGYYCSPSPKVSDGICLPEGEKLDASGGEKKVLTDAELLPSKEGRVFLDGAVVKSPPNCLDDANEPNNYLVDAKGSKVTSLDGMGEGSITGWEICYSGDIDVYSITRSTGQKLVVKVVNFYHKKGDLEAALFDPDGLVLDTSRSENDKEEVSMSTAAVTGKYLIAVWGFKDATNSYDLHLTKN